MTIRDSYIKDFDMDIPYDLERDTRFDSRLPLHVLEIPPEAISPDGTKWLHCVEVTKNKVDTDIYLIRIRVITNTHRGINISVRCDSPLMNLKYLDLRFQVRNSDRILVTFPQLFVSSSCQENRELYLRANDFKIFKPMTDNIQQPTLLI